MPLWFFAGFVDDADQHSKDAYNETKALAGYNIVITGNDSYTTTISSKDIIRSSNYLLANSLNGSHIADSDENWPLRFTGVNVTGSMTVKGVRSIHLVPATSTPSITVTSPNGNETWQRNTSHIVTWSYTGSPGSTVKIVLLKAGAEVGTISSSAPLGSNGAGSYTWPINPVGATGSDYQVSVRSISLPAIADTSNSYFTLTPAANKPSITVKSPNGGELLQRGTSHTVTWNYTGSPGSTVKIVLLKAGAEVGTISSSAPLGSNGAGSYTWPINPVGATGSDYQVSVRSISLPAIADTSNSYFTINPAISSITITSPNGGETWQRNTSHTVTWSYTGSPGSTVKIVLLKAGAEVGTISSSAPLGSNGAGSYTWPINPVGATGSDYQVSVRSISLPAIADTSNNYFSLAQSTIPPSITVASPNGGETWQRNTSHTVTWSYTGSPGSTVKIVLLKAGAEVGTISSSAPLGSNGAGSYTWPINPVGATGNDYQVSVRSINLPAIKDTTNNYFTLIP